MSPADRTDRQPTTVTSCLDACGETVAPGRLRCSTCLEAARVACEQRQPGQSIRPSDVAAVRVRFHGSDWRRYQELGASGAEGG